MLFAQTVLLGNCIKKNKLHFCGIAYKSVVTSTGGEYKVEK